MRRPVFASVKGFQGLKGVVSRSERSVKTDVLVGISAPRSDGPLKHAEGVVQRHPPSHSFAVLDVKLGPKIDPRRGAQASQKNALKPWQKKEWCIPKVSAEFVANMEDLLDLYAEPYDPRRPVVCFDETSTQLLADTRTSLPSRPGIPLRQDYECRREGVRNLFLTCEPLAGWGWPLPVTLKPQPGHSRLQ